MLFSDRGSKTTGTRPWCLIYSHMLSELGLLYEPKLLAMWSTAHWCLKNNKTVLKVPKGLGHMSPCSGHWKRWRQIQSERGEENTGGGLQCLPAGSVLEQLSLDSGNRFASSHFWLPFHPSLAQLCYKESRETCHLFDHHHSVRLCLSPVWDNGWIFRFSIDAWQLRCVSLLSHS